MAGTKIFRAFTESLPTPFQKVSEISLKLFHQGFLLTFKFSEICPEPHREFSEK